MAIALVSHAAFTYGTKGAVVITALGSDNYVDYSGISGDPKEKVYSATQYVTVLNIYGLNGGEHGNVDTKATDPGNPVYYSYALTNYGNTGDSYALNATITYAGTGKHGGAWQFEFYLDANDDKIPDGSAIGSITLNEESATHFLLKVTPSTTAESGARGTVTITAETSSSPSGEYMGANGNTYGGPGFVNDVSNTDILAPIITMTRTATIDSPADYIQPTGSTGAYHIPIPGSVVTITMTYSNVGTATSENNIIIDRVPPGHQAGHVNYTGRSGSFLQNVYVSVPAGTAEGWTVSITTEATLSSAQRQYRNTTGWVQLGTILSSGDFWYSTHGYGYGDTSLTLETTYIKWEKATIEVGVEDGSTLTWGYIIR